MARHLLPLLLALLSARVLPQLLVRLFAKAYPPGDPRAKEMIGEAYGIRPRQRLGWALEQAELAWFEGRAARRLVREQRKELQAAVAAADRQALLEESRRQDEAEFDAFLRGALPERRPRDAMPRRKRAALLPGVLLTSAFLGFGGLAAVGPGAGPRLPLPTPPPGWGASADAVVVTAALLLLGAAAAGHAAHSGLMRRLARRAAASQAGVRRAAYVRVVDPAIKVVVSHGTSTAEGLAIAWSGDRVLVASAGRRTWTPAARVRRAPAT